MGNPAPSNKLTLDKILSNTCILDRGMVDCFLFDNEYNLKPSTLKQILNKALEQQDSEIIELKQQASEVIELLCNFYFSNLQEQVEWVHYIINSPVDPRDVPNRLTSILASLESLGMSRTDIFSILAEHAIPPNNRGDFSFRDIAHSRRERTSTAIATRA